MIKADQSKRNNFQIDQIRIGARILDRFIRWLSPFIVILMVLIITRSIRLGTTVSGIIQVVLLGIVAATAFGDQHLKPTWRIYLYIAATAVIGIVGTFNWGLLGAGHAAVLLAMIFASILGIRRFVIILVILLAAKISVALVWIIGKPPIPLDRLQVMYAPSAWGITIMGSVAAGFAALIWEGIFRRLSAATEQLQESEQRHREIFDAASDALIICDKTGRVVNANDATYVLFGIDPKSAPPYTMTDLSLGESPFSEHEFEKKIAQALDGTPQIFEWQSRKLNGRPFWSEVALRATTIEGKPRLIASIRDSTERKMAEEEMGKLQTQLAQAQKMETVGRLAGGVAHDFNNMLSVILGHVGLVLKQTRPEQKIYGSLQEIQHAAQRSADLTRQLLAYARKQTISPKVLQLNDTLSGMITMLQRLIGEMMNIIWVPGAGLWRVKIDPGQIDQILSNLCLNARDAVQRRGTIIIKTQNITLDAYQCSDIPDCEPGDYVMLSVEDDGSGMDAETMSKVFEPFFTTKDVGEGTGLGLSTVYGIMKQNKGFIQVESKLMHGSCFKIFFPRYHGEIRTTAEIYPYDGKSQTADTKKLPESKEYGPETILLVEDEPAILNLGKLILEKQGYQVLAATSPGEAIQTAEVFSGDIDLLITDVVMPEMNGRELAKRMLTLYPDIKRLFMSGYTADVIAHHGVLDDAEHFLQKPFLVKELIDKVRFILDTP
jgi:PAS domain S-box-containing protein